jgi:hypothetical protein
MKKIMSLMLGLTLLTGAVAFASPQDKDTTTTKKTKTKKKSKTKSSDKMTTSNPTK